MVAIGGESGRGVKLGGNMTAVRTKQASIPHRDQEWTAQSSPSLSSMLKLLHGEAKLSERWTKIESKK